MIRVLVVVACLWSFASSAQTAPTKYWIQFTDKSNSPYSLQAPEAFLSQEALIRRAKNGYPITTEDLPVNEDYIAAVTALGNVQVMHTSRWFNAISAKIVDDGVVAAIEQLPFVLQVKKVPVYQQPAMPEYALRSTVLGQDTSAYGYGLQQIVQLNGLFLHGAGFTGSGMKIGVMDAGFKRVPVLPVFDQLYAENRLHEVHDFVDWDNTVTDHHYHGMYVLSTMAGNLADSLIGTAPGADYYLFRTEDGETEYVLEEDNWVAAIEEADRMGIWVVNTSLGYSTFDDPSQDHTYADMDGRTTRIAIASTMAARRGMLLVTSAGNLGSSPWRYISTPGDADSVLTVGAVNTDGIHAPFSSFGPTADGRIKPNVCALGQGAWFAAPDSTIRRGNGTSFASPILCGLAACLWQAHPEATNMDILRAIEKSASLYNQPNDSLGYGIPDFFVAHRLLQEQTGVLESSVILYPNPSSGVFHFEADVQISRIVVFDLRGRELGDVSCVYTQNDYSAGIFDLREAGLSAGQYLVRFEGEGYIRTVRANLQ
ncbi:MAG: hypothetical protein RL226_2141 [Bacteroidota bacterium]|jgi:subtilisin family serine protease